MCVGDIVEACEYIGFMVVDPTCKMYHITSENAKEIYAKSINHIDAVDGIVRIWIHEHIKEE